MLFSFSNDSIFSFPVLLRKFFDLRLSVGDGRNEFFSLLNSYFGIIDEPLNLFIGKPMKLKIGLTCEKSRPFGGLCYKKTFLE